MKADYHGLDVTVMGLGLNGGGLESARFLASRGARVTVTDLRGPDVLGPSLRALDGLDIRYVLGRHETEDFTSCDFVVKNPAVPADSPYLKAAKRVETDISLFLSACRNPILAVTGSKGKSSTASAIHHALRSSHPAARLGGNITRSPLSFLDELDGRSPVVLELSSWQLGDLRGKPLLKPAVALITNIHPDHQDRYGSMQPYVDDKRLIYRNQDRNDFSVFYFDDAWGPSFVAQTSARALVFSARELPSGVEGGFLNSDGQGFFRLGGSTVQVLPEKLSLAGAHQRINLLAAACVLAAYGLPAASIAEGLASFPGIEHRLEFVRETGGVRYYNDSAATIPQATLAALASFREPVHLITGGTDKALDFTPFARLSPQPEAIYLLAGSATDKLMPLLAAAGTGWRGPFDSLAAALHAARAAAAAGRVVVLSPGCASFGMFLNEFDRGRQFKDLVARL